MKKGKILVIVSLVVAVITLTVGFAAFSNTLTIKSSATVSPDPSDFKMVVYGINDDSFDADNWFWNYSEAAPLSSTVSVPRFVMFGTGANAIINNDSLTIDFPSVNFVKKGDEVYYYFEIVNEGKYDAYFGGDEFSNIASVLTNQKVCTADVGTSQDMVDSACSAVEVYAYAHDELSDVLLSPSSDGKVIKIEPGKNMRICFQFSYGGDGLADGDWNIDFPITELTFSTVDPSTK